MSQKKISELTEVQSVNEELCSVPVDNGTETVRITLKNLEASATASAKTYSEQAAASATSSQNAADAAANSSNNASTYASNASDSAAEAAGSATNASSFADAAGASASNASSSASQAANTAATVAQQVTNASNSAKLAESFAHGGTGARAGEDTDNAEYWARMAEAMHDGVASFNGRQGIVNPANGDYSASMISRGNSNVDNALASLEEDMSDLQTGKEDAPTTLVATLAAGATSLVFEDDSIKADSLVDGYSDPYGVTPTNATGTVGSITLTFDPQETATKITLLIR